jgi:hypothetical protein
MNARIEHGLFERLSTAPVCHGPSADSANRRQRCCGPEVSPEGLSDGATHHSTPLGDPDVTIVFSHRSAAWRMVLGGMFEFLESYDKSDKWPSATGTTRSRNSCTGGCS